jgi:hypothetical protein
VELTNWLRSSRWFSFGVFYLKCFAAFFLHRDISRRSNSQVLGTPTREEIKCMNPNYTEFKFPQIKAHPWHKVTCMETSCS